MVNGINIGQAFEDSAAPVTVSGLMSPFAGAADGYTPTQTVGITLDNNLGLQ